MSRFSNLGILHVTKRGVVEVLTKRLKEEKRRIKEPGYKFTGKSVISLFNWTYSNCLLLTSSFDKLSLLLSFRCRGTGYFARGQRTGQKHGPKHCEIKVHRLLA